MTEHRPRCGALVRTAAVVAMAAAAVIGTIEPAVAVPAPASTISPTVFGVVDVFGATSTGAVFYRTVGGDQPGSYIRQADGASLYLGGPFGGRGEVMSDDRLWAPLWDGLRAYAEDGSWNHYKLGFTSPEGSAVEVRQGVDGRAWFLDTARNAIGAMDLDGTDVVEWPVTGPGKLSHLAKGPDGRMWFLREGGALAAITVDGTVTQYGTLGRSKDGLVSNASGLYASGQGGLLRIAADGRVDGVATPNGSVNGTPVESQGWIWIGTTSVSPSGRIAQYGLPIDFDYVGSGGPLPRVDARRVTYAGSRQGGFVGSISGRLVRYANPDIGRNVVVRASVVEVKGVRYLRLAGSARTPGGTAVSGTYAVRMEWDRYIPDGLTYYQNASKRIGTMTISAGKGSVDIPVTSTLIAGTTRGFLDHGTCCSVYLQAAATPQGEGLSSRGAGVSDTNGTLEMSSTMQWLDRMNGRALARPMDAAGSVYWAQKLATGTPRSTVTRSIVHSTAWRRQRVTSAYQRWLGRKPDAAGLEYWQKWLETHATSELDFALGTTASARDAGGTTNVARGKHLASALRLASASAEQYTKQLDAGASWNTVVRTAYFSPAAQQRRMSDLAPRSSYTPSLSALVAEFGQSRDERGPLVKALATMP